MGVTEKSLGVLFDFQRFEANQVLSRLIREAEERYPRKTESSGKYKGFRIVGDEKTMASGGLPDGRRELSDSEISWVNAAGQPDMGDKPRSIEEQGDRL